LLAGIGHQLFFEKLRVLDALTAFRVPTLLFAFALFFSFFLFAAELYGRAIAGVATLGLLLMPRVFFHGHLVSLDYSITALIFCAGFTYWRSERHAGWMFATGLILGLGMLTKINAAFAYIPISTLMLFRSRAALARLFGTRSRTSAVACLRIAVRHLPLLALPCLMFFALWPWLWLDPIGRALAFFGFHLTHADVPAFYLGEPYREAPFHYPFVITLVTIPVVSLVVILIGIARSHRGRTAPATLYIAMSALVPLIVVAMPGIPKYDGARLFLTAFPFLALLLGRGLAALLERLSGSRARRAALGAYALGLVATTVPAMAKVHPYEFCYFNELVCGYRGAFALGFESEYWGSSYRALIPWLNQNADKTFRVPIGRHLLAMSKRHGRLDPAVRLGQRDRYDYLVLLTRQGMFREAEWRYFRDETPVVSIGPPGLGLVNVYEFENP
jgi:4-amino-4-deoxy-L-arabinose transferase-like glycosyltransferase